VASETDIPKIVNVAEIRQTLSEPILLHFTAEQWKHVSEGVKEVDKLSTDYSTLEFMPMPGGRGIMLAAMGPCPPDCTPMYDYRGMTPEEFEQILIGCKCGAGGLDGDQLSKECRLAIQLERGQASGLRARSPKFICVDRNGKPCPDYEIASSRRQGGGFIYGCRHR
jgi:hypothetical protein